MAPLDLHVSTQVAVVGCGQWGRNLARDFAKLGKLTAVVDSITSQAEQLALQYGTRSLDWETCIQDPAVTAIVLATPASSHAKMAVQALEAGKHVFVEKPLALSILDGQRVLAAAEQARKVVNVGHLFHYHPAFIKLKAIVLGGGLGRIRHIHSTRFALGRIRHQENAFWSLAPHDISMILGLTGGISPTGITANGSFHLDQNIADVVNAYMEFPNGVRAQISVSWMHPQRERKLTVIGDKAMAVFDDCQPWDTKLQIFQNAIEWKSGLPEAPKEPLLDVENVALSVAQPLLEECRDFVNSIEKGEISINNVQEGLSVLGILSAVEDLLQTSRTNSSQSSTKLISSEALQNNSIEKTAVVDASSTIGHGTKISHFTHVKAGAHIGKHCKIGQGVTIGQGVIIGNRCKIKENVSVYEGVEVGDGVFCGPSCVFTNVLTPRAEVERKHKFLSTIVRRGSTIGANATIICGVELGEYCMVGAGAVVTKSVMPYALMVGNPARQVGWVSAAGEPLGPDLVCPMFGSEYQINSAGLLIPVEAGNRSPREQDSAQPKGMPAALEHVQLVDLQVQKTRIKQEVHNRISKVLEGTNFIMGPEVTELEQRLSRLTGAAHVISCANGTDALTLALIGLELCPGDAVLVPTFTFVATVEPVALLGAVPVFVDVNPATLTLDASLITAGVRAAQKAGKRAVGVIAVDLFGHPADYPSLSAAAALHDLWVLADAAQSFGASIDGRNVGTLAKVTTTSFFPSKPLGCYGDGGAVFTDDADIADRLRSIRLHGRSRDEKFENVLIGINSRLDTIQAAVLLAKLEIFPQEMEARQEVSSRYHRMLSGLVTTPEVNRGVRSAWASYTIRSTDRDVMRERLHSSGISTAIYYPRPIHTQEAYKAFPIIAEGCPVAELASRQVLSLPMHPYLEVDAQQRVYTIIKSTIV